jgi:hypothetical protein
VDLVDLDGLSVAYTRVGDGPPLVLLPGYVGDGPTTWQRQLEDLSDDSLWSPGMLQGPDGLQIPPRTSALQANADCGKPGRAPAGLGARGYALATRPLIALNATTTPTRKMMTAR